MTVQSEITALKTPDGLIHPPDVVAWAQANPASELHRRFEWDDSRAAHAWRVEQARNLIAIYVVDVNFERLTISLTRDRLNGGGYRDRDTVLSNSEMRREALLEALAELERWQHRNSHFAKEFKAIFNNIGRLKSRFAPTSNPRRQPPPDQPGATAAPPP